MGDIADQITATQDAEWEEHEARMFAEYDGTDCKFCSRQRVGVNDQGRRVCDKCDRFQDTEFGEYIPHDKEGQADG